MEITDIAVFFNPAIYIAIWKNAGIEIISDNWCCFSFWHQVFFFCNFLLFVAFQCCYQQLSPCEGVWSASAHWLRTNVIGGSLHMHSVCTQVPLKLDEFICLLHRRPCDVTVACKYITYITVMWCYSPTDCYSPPVNCTQVTTWLVFTLYVFVSGYTVAANVVIDHFSKVMASQTLWQPT